MKKDIVELKSLRTPPALIVQILEAVQCLLKRPVGFANAKKSIGQKNILDDLYQIKGRIDSGDDYSVVYKTVKKITIQPDFNVEKCQSVNVAGTRLMMWVLATVKYIEYRNLNLNLFKS